jgi:hypothetical protein
MINRLKELLEEPDEPRPPDDYYEIEARFETFYVSRAEGERVLRLLRRIWVPRWITFTALSSAQVRIRSRLIESVQECRAAQRVAARAFHRARRQEEKAERRPWEDDDWW